MIAVVDYGTCNTGSIVNMLKRVGADAAVAASPEALNGADKIILPGVGAFDTGMTYLQNAGFIDILHRRVIEDRIPILGICLGAQLFTQGSEEGEKPGLGWFDAVTRRFSLPADKFKVPHMGWNRVRPARPDALFAGYDEDPRFYFVHSYYMSCARPEDVLAETAYGVRFVSAIGSGNIMGVQFHPEKSHRFGMQLLRNFAQAKIVKGVD